MSCNWLSILLLHNLGIVGQDQVCEDAQHIHTLFKRQRLKPTCLGFDRFLFGDREKSLGSSSP
jgi:hypothetical protein